MPGTPLRIAGVPAENKPQIKLHFVGTPQKCTVAREGPFSDTSACAGGCTYMSEWRCHCIKCNDMPGVLRARPGPGLSACRVRPRGRWGYSRRGWGARTSAVVGKRVFVGVDPGGAGLLI